jgi:hypothetical protein
LEERFEEINPEDEVRKYAYNETAANTTLLSREIQ